MVKKAASLSTSIREMEIETSSGNRMKNSAISVALTTRQNGHHFLSLDP